MAMASLRLVASKAMKILWILMRSKWLLAGSRFRASRAASSSALKRRGQGPAATSPSKRLALRGQAASRIVGMLSLKI